MASQRTTDMEFALQFRNANDSAVDATRFSLGKIVCIAHPDVSCASLRILYNTTMSEHSKGYWMCHRGTFPDMNETRIVHQPLMQLNGNIESSPFDVLSFGSGEENHNPNQNSTSAQREFSLVLLNTPLNSSQATLVVNSLLELCVESQSERVVLLTSLFLPQAKELGPFYHPISTQKSCAHSLDSEKALETLPAMKPEWEIKDTFVISFLHLAALEEAFSSCIVSTKGVRFHPIRMIEDDGTDEVINRLSDAIVRVAPNVMLHRDQISTIREKIEWSGVDRDITAQLTTNSSLLYR